MTDRSSGRPRILAVFTAGVASATGFFVITRSGLAGTLAGAAVASMIYTGAAHGVGVAIDRGASWWIERRRVRAAGPESCEPLATSDSAGDVGPAGSALAEGGTGDGIIVAGASGETAPRGEISAPAGAYTRAGRLLAAYGPLALAILALGVSAFSVVTGTPLETVVVRERVVEKPVVQERVVVEQSTVTVTVPVVVAAAPRQDSSVGTAAPSATTTSTAPPTSTTSTTVGGTTPATDTPAAVTTTTAPATPPSTPPETAAP